MYNNDYLFYDLDTFENKNYKCSLEPYFTKNNIPIYNINVEQEFSDDDCDRIIEYVQSRRLYSPLDRNNEPNKINTAHIHHIDISEHTSWIYRKASDLLKKINEFYKIDVKTLSRIQYAEYNPNEYFDWHVDDNFVYYNNQGNRDYLMRKISVSISLNGPNDYEDGHFEVLIPDKGESTVLSARNNKGAALSFLSFLPHRVAPVSKGTRRSLVFWYYGPAWK